MKQENKGKSRKISTVWRWIAGIIAGLILLICGAALYLSQHWKPLIADKVKEAVTNSTDSLYTIDFDDLSMNLLTGNVSFYNIVFKPNLAVHQQMKAVGDAPQHLYQVTLDGLILKRINPWKIYFSKKLDISSIVISKPAIKVWYEENKFKEAKPKDKRTAYQRLSNFLKSLKIGSIILDNVDLQYTERSKAAPEVIALKNLSIKITDLLIDSASQYDTTRFYHTKDIFAELKNYQFVTKDKMYTIKLKDLTSSAADGYVKIKGLQLVPNYPDLEFSRKYKEQHDRYDMKFNEITLKDVDFLRFDVEHKLFAKSLIIDGALLNVFLNRELPPAGFDKIRNFPHVALQRMDLKTKIDSIYIKGLNINYTEYNPKTSRRGTISINDASGTVVNITNDSVSLVKNKWGTADLTALVMGKSQLKLHLNLNLTDKAGAFNYQGSVGRMDLTVLNPVAKALAMLEVTSGTLEKVDFDLSANSKGANGRVNMYYKNFKIAVLKKEDEDTSLKKRGIVSALANVLVIKNNNPDDGQPFRVGKSSFERLYSSSFFNTLWNGLFSGIKTTIGLSVEMQATMQQKAAGSVDKKDDREDKREERKKRRDERRKKRDDKNETTLLLRSSMNDETKKE